MKILPLVTICFVLLGIETGSAQIMQTDREFEGLKGKVRSVLTEKADAVRKGGRIVETKRRKHSYIEFLPNGDTSVRKAFHWETGELVDTDTFLRIDGDKAFKTETGPAAMTAVVIEEPQEKNPAKPWDPRFDYRSTYKYDRLGRTIEHTMWQGDGDLWLRYVYEYALGERRESVFDANGALNQKYTYKLDAYGNELEMIAFDTETGAVEGKEKYEYLRFDPKGNWTKRVEYEADSDSGFKFKIREVKYRALTYFP